MILILDVTNVDDINRLKQFSKMDHPSTFRYFKNRIFEEAIKSHILTILYHIDGKDAGYAHVDIDNVTGNAYFGVCVMPPYQKMGIGGLLTRYIVENYKNTLFLTVDNENIHAMNLYKKYGFVLIESYETSSLWRRS